MKKIRLEKTSPHLNPLAQKRNSVQQEPANRKGEPDGLSMTKGPFQSIKSEICSIKQDFQKLIRKEINLKAQPLTLLNSNRQKGCSSSRKDARPSSGTEHYQTVTPFQEHNQQYHRVLNLDINLPCYSTGAESARNKEPKREFTTQNNSTADVSNCQPSGSSAGRRPTNEVERLEKELFEYTKKLEQLSLNYDSVTKQKESISNHLHLLSTQLSAKVERIHNLESENKDLLQNVSTLQCKLDSASKIAVEERNQLSHDFDDLLFHYEQLKKAHQQAVADNEMLRITISNIEQYCDETQKRQEIIDHNWKKKVEFLEQDLKGYRLREDMFSSEIEKLRDQLTNQQEVVSGPPKQGGEELQQMKEQIEHLRRQVVIEKQLHASLSQKYDQKIGDSNGVADVAIKLQQKLTEVVEQNRHLKTKLNYAEAQVQSLRQQNRSYLEEIKLYEERDRNQNTHKKITHSEWETMTEEIELLREKNKLLSEEIQLRGSERNGEVEKLQNPMNEQLIRLTHIQIAEIEELRKNVRELTQKHVQVSRECEKLKIQLLHCGVDVEGRVVWLKGELDRKSKIIEGLKQLIFRVIVEKGGQFESEEQIKHILDNVAGTII